MLLNIMQLKLCYEENGKSHKNWNMQPWTLQVHFEEVCCNKTVFAILERPMFYLQVCVFIHTMAKW